jgi:hypothetical protein
MSQNLQPNNMIQLDTCLLNIYHIILIVCSIPHINTLHSSGLFGDYAKKGLPLGYPRLFKKCFWLVCCTMTSMWVMDKSSIIYLIYRNSFHFLILHIEVWNINIPAGCQAILCHLLLSHSFIIEFSEHICCLNQWSCTKCNFFSVETWNIFSGFVVGLLNNL